MAGLGQFRLGRAWDMLQHRQQRDDVPLQVGGTDGGEVARLDRETLRPNRCGEQGLDTVALGELGAKPAKEFAMIGSDIDHPSVGWDVAAGFAMRQLWMKRSRAFTANYRERMLIGRRRGARANPGGHCRRDVA